MRRRCVAGAAALIVSSLAVGPSTPSTQAATAGYVSLASPARLLDTRVGEPTADGLDSDGLRPFGTVTTLQVAGRVGIPAGVSSVVLNVTAQSAAEGFITVFPCGGTRPTASNLNYAPGQTVPNMVVTRLDAQGRACLFNGGATHLVVDVAGYFPDAESLVALAAPARVLDTRPGEPTVDGQSSGMGPRAGGTETVVPIAGRAGVPADASSVVLNVTVANAVGNGFVTAYPCGTPRPTASNLNFVRSQTVPNAVVARLGNGGAICLYTHGTTNLVVDVAGYFPDATVLVPLPSPARLLDSRGELTVDGQFRGGGVRPNGGTVQLRVAGRAGVPAGASAVVLNVTVVDPVEAGVITVYPTGSTRPTASNLNFAAGQTVPNAVTARVGAGGDVCIYNVGSTHLVVDVAAYIAGPPPPAAGPTCPADPPPPVAPVTPTSPVAQPAGNCHPSYSGACVPAGVSDVDCAGGGGNGPYYVAGPFRVVGPDVYDLDRDNDGWACE